MTRRLPRGIVALLGFAGFVLMLTVWIPLCTGAQMLLHAALTPLAQAVGIA